MTGLILKNFQGMADTDKAFADNLCFVTFVGRLPSDGNLQYTDVKVIRQGATNWHHNVERGELWNINVAVQDNLPLNSTLLVLVAMVEEDNAANLLIWEPFLKASMDAYYKGLTSATNLDFVSSQTKQRFETLIKMLRGDDDIIGVRETRITNQPGHVTFHFTGENSDYRVNLVVQ